MAALPLDLIYEYINRPKKLSEKEIADKFKILKDQASHLGKLAKEVKNKYKNVQNSRTGNKLFSILEKRKNCNFEQE